MTTAEAQTEAWRPQVGVTRRRLTRQLEIVPRDLDPVATQRLDAYVKLPARLDLLDRHLAACEVAHSDDGASPLLAAYAPLATAAQEALTELVEHLAAKHRHPGDGRAEELP